MVPMKVELPARLVDAADSLRDVYFRNDAFAQAEELARVAAACPLRAEAPGSAAPFEQVAVGEALQELEKEEDFFVSFVKMEARHQAARAEVATASDAKMAVLREEHRARVEDRRAILHESMMKRLAAERISLE